MKNSVIILTVLLGVIIVFGGFNYAKYASAIKEQNSVLMEEIGQINKKITALERDKTMEKLIALKSENASLKGQLEKLQRQLLLLSQEKEGTGQAALSSRKKISQKIQPEKKLQHKCPEIKPAAGNRGFLIKDGKPS